MAEQNGKENAEAKGKKPKKPIEYKRFERLLRKVMKSPPLRRTSSP
jgi:hypothetical protein